MRHYHCRGCKKDLGDLPLTYLCAECFERYRRDSVFREEYHRKYPREGEYDTHIFEPNVERLVQLED